MIDPLAMSTEGTISRSIRRTLTIATIGWIVITGTTTSDTVHVKSLHKTGRFNFAIENRRLLIADENEVLEIIKAFTECQK